jgi:hypothetical protein
VQEAGRSELMVSVCQFPLKVNELRGGDERVRGSCKCYGANSKDSLMKLAGKMLGMRGGFN